MCNSYNHPPGCTCGFGGDGHLGRRGPSYSSPNSTYRYSPPQPPIRTPKEIFLERYPEFNQSWRASACFVNPNATCPVCGQSVFYYQNEFGSRVFFDDLGPPWPKHPCTDKQSGTPLVSEPELGLTFSFRSQQDIASILRQQNDLGIRVESDFETKHGTPPWPLARILRRIKGRARVFIVADLLGRDPAKRIYFSCKRLPRYCDTGFLFAVRKKTISFIDPASFSPVTGTIRRYRGAKSFLDAIIVTED